MELERQDVFVYCIECLPRLKSVQLSFHTSDKKMSLSKQSLIAKDVEFGSCKLDLSSHSHISMADSILSLKLRSSSLLHTIPPPSDVLADCVSNPAVVTLVCSFCNSILTSKDK